MDRVINNVRLAVIKTWAVVNGLTVPLDGNGEFDDADPEHISHIHGVWQNNMSSPCPCNGVHHDVDYMPPPSSTAAHAKDLDATSHAAMPLLFTEDHATLGGLDDEIIDISSDNSSASAVDPSEEVYVSNSFASLAVNEDDGGNSSEDIDIPDDLHEVVAHRACAHDKRALDSTIGLRRSSRLAGKEGPTFLDMTSKAIRARARKFDLSAASSGLAAAIDAAGLAANPEVPSEDSAALSLIALQCGATVGDVRELTSVVNSEP